MALMMDRKISVPPGFAERSCLQLSYRLPGLPHCHVLCHDLARIRRVSITAWPASSSRRPKGWHWMQLAIRRAYMLILSGASIRRRANLHVFFVQRRWQKAWVYLLLGAKNLGLEAWLLFKHVSRGPASLPDKTSSLLSGQQISYIEPFGLLQSAKSGLSQAPKKAD